MRHDACVLAPRCRAGLRSLSFYKLWQDRNARNADEIGKKEAYPRAVQGFPADGVLHAAASWSTRPDTKKSEWPLVIGKELVDNALDAAEDAHIPPVVSITVKAGTESMLSRSSDAATVSTIIIKDNGRGIPAETIKDILDYSIRVSSREAYVSPTRGAQGNALKTILPMGYVLQEGEDAASETIIEAHGVAHHILFSVDHIKQEPKIEHTTKASSVIEGTKITVNLPTCHKNSYYDFDAVADCEDEFLKLAESYAWLNPHLTLRVTWNGSASSTSRPPIRTGRNGHRRRRHRRIGTTRAACAATWRRTSPIAATSPSANLSASLTASPGRRSRSWCWPRPVPHTGRCMTSSG